MEKLTPAEKAIIETLGHIQANVNALTVFTKSTHKEVKNIEKGVQDGVQKGVGSGIEKNQEKSTDIIDKVKHGNTLLMIAIGSVWALTLVDIVLNIISLVR